MEKPKQKESSQLAKQLFTLAIVVNVLALILRIGLKLYTGESWLSIRWKSVVDATPIDVIFR